MVWESQKEQIKTAELEHAHKMQSKTKEYVSAEERWWFDTEKRAWDVSRPVALGIIDSTHMSTVNYLIEGTVVMSWDVNTEKKTVAMLKA